MKRFLSVSLILVFLLLQGCSLDFLSDQDTDPAKSGYTQYDDSTDIKYYYDGNDKLVWMEYYDFDDEGNCIFMKHCSPSGTVLWSYVYTWDGEKMATESYFDINNNRTWYKHFIYNAQDKIAQICYYEGDSPFWFETFTYDGSDTLLKSSLYGAEGNRSAYVEWEYDGSGRVIKKTGYGETGSGNSFDGSFTPCVFPDTGGINTENRNDAGLAAPTPPAPSTVFDDTPALPYKWMSLWVYTAYGSSMATLNENRLPVYMKVEAPDYLSGRPIQIELTYDGSNRPVTKTTTYNGQTVLALEFGYEGGFLTSLDTTGAGLLVPLRYEFTYLPQGIPQSIGIYNEETLLQRFVYEYSGSPATPEEFAKEVHTIHHFDGDDQKIGYYVFSYDEGAKTITINVWDTKDPDDTEDDENTGYFVLNYDDDDLTTGFAGYDASGSKMWDYRFDYDDLGNRISETRLDDADIPEVVYTFDVEPFFEDLRRFLP